MRRRTERFITVHANSRATASFPIKILMTWKPDYRNIKVTGRTDKEDPLDFVLWKPKKDGEPYWESPWCEGRPGWHIECSVMAKKYLGDDHRHPCRRRGSVSSRIMKMRSRSQRRQTVGPFAHYWMHNGFLNIDNQKMSKSLGNFFTVREIGEKYDLAGAAFLYAERALPQPAQFQRGTHGCGEKRS